MFSITDLMTPSPITLYGKDTLYDAKIAMIKNKIRHIPIINTKREFIGLITQRDVLSHCVSSLAELSERELKKIECSILIEDIMVTDVFVAQQNETEILDAVQHLHQYKHGCLPVLAGQKLIGIVTDNDFLRLTVQLLEKK